MAKGLRKVIVLASQEAWYPGFRTTLATVRAGEWASTEELRAQQRDRLVLMLRFALDNVPYYRRILSCTQITSCDTWAPPALALFPIVRREDLKKNPSDFVPRGRRSMWDRNGASHGTTGTPLSYRLSRHDRAVGLALLYRGWGYAGYSPGDSVVVLAGRSLGSVSGLWHHRLGDVVRNMVKLSAFDMTDEALDDYVAHINRAKPHYIRGYPTAIQALAERIQRACAAVWQPRAVFTTAETLLPTMRDRISSTFGCPVFDGYGLNDGGVSAYECEEHAGLHIDTERALLEVIDEQGMPLENGIGRIIATTLTNHAMPLIRYDTGDIGEISKDPCPCGRPRPLLKAIRGRSTDILVTPEGKLVHGWFFMALFGELCQGVQEFRVIQESISDLSILLVPTTDFDSAVPDFVLRAVKELSPGWVVRIQTVDALSRTEGGKMKFVESKVKAVDYVT